MRSETALERRRENVMEAERNTKRQFRRRKTEGGKERRVSLNSKTNKNKKRQEEKATPVEIDEAQQKSGCGCLGSSKIEHPFSL